MDTEKASSREIENLWCQGDVRWARTVVKVRRMECAKQSNGESSMSSIIFTAEKLKSFIQEKTRRQREVHGRGLLDSIWLLHYTPSLVPLSLSIRRECAKWGENRKIEIIGCSFRSGHFLLILRFSSSSRDSDKEEFRNQSEILCLHEKEKSCSYFSKESEKLLFSLNEGKKELNVVGGFAHVWKTLEKDNFFRIFFSQFNENSNARSFLFFALFFSLSISLLKNPCLEKYAKAKMRSLWACKRFFWLFLWYVCHE